MTLNKYSKDSKLIVLGSFFTCLIVFVIILLYFHVMKASFTKTLFLTLHLTFETFHSHSAPITWAFLA